MNLPERLIAMIVQISKLVHEVFKRYMHFIAKVKQSHLVCFLPKRFAHNCALWEVVFLSFEIWLQKYCSLRNGGFFC